MAGRDQGDLHPVALDGFAVGERLARAGEILAVTHPHDVEGFRRRRHRAMPGAGVVGMAVG